MVGGSDPGKPYVPRRNTGEVDHIFVACLECRFKGKWQVVDTTTYRSMAEGAEVRLVQLNGTRKYIKFKNGAYVALLSSNIVTYESEDEMQSLYVNEDEREKTPLV